MANFRWRMGIDAENRRENDERRRLMFPAVREACSAQERDTDFRRVVCTIFITKKQGKRFRAQPAVISDLPVGKDATGKRKIGVI